MSFRAQRGIYKSKSVLAGKIKVILLALTLVVLTTGITACSKTKEQTPQEKKTEVEKQQTSSADKNGILMLGRSVMGGWFTHWNAENNTATRNGFTLYYGEMETPPDIIDSAQTILDEKGSGAKIVFFKLCFDDFDGGSYSEARANLNRNKKYIQEIYDAVVKDMSMKLILGNALPRVKKYNEGNLVWNHKEYNQFLKEFAAKHPGEVYIFNEYSVLADSAGNLKADFATDAEDSHPNDKAYSALDGPFFKLLETLKQQ